MTAAMALILAGSLAAGGIHARATEEDSPQQFTLTLENSWYLGWTGGDNLAEITYESGLDRIWLLGISLDQLYTVPVEDPTIVEDTLDVPCDSPSGIAVRGTGYSRYLYLVDSNYQGDYWVYHNDSWLMQTGNPAGEYGTALEVEESGWLWETVHYYGIMRFYPGSGTYQMFDYHTPDESGSGITIFPYAGQTGVAVSYFGYDRVEFYVFDPPDILTFTGDAEIPVEVDCCCGLEYVPERSTFYMPVRISGLTHMLELGCDILELRQDTWGGIKSMF
ncbi:MAG: hypothetical protein R6U39_08710 [Candidatus Aegiribacteria sp.]